MNNPLLIFWRWLREPRYYCAKGHPHATLLAAEECSDLPGYVMFMPMVSRSNRGQCSMTERSEGGILVCNYCGFGRVTGGRRECCERAILEDFTHWLASNQTELAMEDKRVLYENLSDLYITDVGTPDPTDAQR